MMNKILVFLNETPEVKIAVTVLIIIAVAVIIGLLLRSTRLWYWKTDKIIDSINDMGGRIDHMEEEMGSVKISAERLIEEIRFTNDALFAIREQIALLPEAGEQSQPEESEESPAGTETAGAEAPENEKPGTGEILREQVDDLEKALRELRKQKEQLEADINSRIRD